MTQAAGIEVQNLCVRFKAGSRVLDDLSLSVKPGEIIGLLGGSGSGKSTLLRTIARLQTHESGTVDFTGPIPKRRASDLAYVFQDATLLPWRTARENVSLPLELQTSVEARSQSNGSSAKQRIEEALQSVGLPETSWNRFPRELSGGMRMRVSLARAIVTDPAVLLLDEPFAALDEILRGKMNELIVDLWTRRKRTILFVTHNIAEAINLSQRIAILGEGKIRHWIENTLPFPRTAGVRSSHGFAELYANVAQRLTETVNAA